MQTLLSENITASLRLPNDGTRNLVVHRWLSVILAVVVLIVAASASAAQGAEFQPASYSRTSPRGDKLILKFGEKQRFILSDEHGKTMVEGTYKVVKDQIEFTDENGPFASKDAKPGKYKWELAEGKLNFTKVEDESEGRSKGIAGATWTLEK
jgi:hypothetical protein